MKSFTRSIIMNHIRDKPSLEPLKNRKFLKIIKNISRQTLLGYSAKIKFGNVYLKNNVLKLKNSMVYKKTIPDMVPLKTPSNNITFNINAEPIELPKEHMISFYHSQYGGGNGGGGGGQNNILLPIIIAVYCYFITKK